MAKKIKKKKINKIETAEFDVHVEEDFLSLKFYSLAYVIIAIVVAFFFRMYFLFYWN